MRPKILVSGAKHGGTFQWWASALAVRRAGGRPVRVTRGDPLPSEFDGLILGGGADLYTDDPNATVQRRRWREAIDPARDQLEMTLLRRSLDTKRPVLGICRGAQLINVTLGGTLVPDVRSFYVELPHLRTVRPRQRVTLTKGTRLRNTLDTDEVWVNALHHQAIDTVGDALTIVARNDHGIVQGIEHDSAWVIGVQWHPELIPQHQRQQRIFRALVGAARARINSTDRSERP